MKESHILLVGVLMVVLALMSYRATYALFSNSATSNGNVFSAAAEFPQASPLVSPTILGTETGIPTSTITPTQTPTSSPTPTPSARPALVVINEFMPHPGTGDEWVEIINLGESPENLTGWGIFDGNSSRTDDLFLSGSINPGQIIAFNHAAAWLNDSGDSLNLENNFTATVSATSYASSTIDKSLGHAVDGVGVFKICTTFTKGSTNNGFC